MTHDRLAFSLLLREVIASLRAMRRADLLWIGLGGAFLLAYAAAGLTVALRVAAEPLRQSPWLWRAGLPCAALMLGLVAGQAVARLGLSRAHSPFLSALPLSQLERRRMSAFAAGCIGVALTTAVTALLVVACMLIAKPHALLWGAVPGILFATGFGTGVALRLRKPLSPPADRDCAGELRTRRNARSNPTLTFLDRGRPTWLGAWAWRLPAGEFMPTWRVVAITVAMSLVAMVLAAATVIQHQAVLGATAGVAGGLLTFMLGLRCHPLGSPVLRTAPLGFWRVWLRLARLPLVLSAAFFLLPAGAALAAEPSSWAIPVSSGLWLLALNGTYAVFAAYFLDAPLVAAVSFMAAISYTSYESLEYGRTVVLGLAGLVLWLWHRARRRYYHG